MKRIGTALRAAVSLGLCAALLAGCSLLPSDPAPEQPVPTDPLTGQEQLWPGQRPVAVVNMELAYYQRKLRSICRRWLCQVEKKHGH